MRATSSRYSMNSRKRNGFRIAASPRATSPTTASRAGTVKLAFDLRQRGVADNIIEAVLSDNRDSELERAQAVWQKKFGSAPANMTEKARQMRFLQSRGFGTEVIRRVIHDAADA
jgi:SOS response regulatory protein OraA/RecX